MYRMNVRELHSRLAGGDAPSVLLDVREPWEFNICHIDGSKLIPMHSLIARLAELDPHAETVVICHHGVRSRQVAHFLEQQGFSRVINLEGGVAAWAQEVDPMMPIY